MTEIQINDWKSAYEYIEGLICKNSNILNRYFFRGQSVSSWKLETSITRLVKGDNISEEKAIYHERQGLNEFKSMAHLTDERLVYDPFMEDIALYIDMQHYSCPTRFLDWSKSPYIALYFAVSDSFNDDCSLYVWDYLFYMINMKELHMNFKELPPADLFEFEDYNLVQIFLPTKKNERLYRQQGVFSVSNNIIEAHCELIDSIGNELSKDSGLSKIVISKESKMEILDRLKYMNITANSLFPGLDGIGKEIRESLLLRKWKKK